jgi:hypothetical protein
LEELRRKLMHKNIIDTLKEELIKLNPEAPI